MKHKNFACFILTHGRPNNVITQATLRRQGYSGRIFYVVDDEDQTINEYKSQFGDSVVVFSKEKYFSEFDTCDNGGSRKVIFPARNACFDIANTLAIDYFLELDDDYKAFQFRYPEGNVLKIKEFKNLDVIFDAFLDFLEVSQAKTVAFCQGGDMIGGVHSGTFSKGLIRKAMNAFFCKTNRRINFVGRINEDVCTYTMLSNIGELFFSVTSAMLVQNRTQEHSGGMTETYLDNGTYLKSFYSVIVAPQAVKVGMMNSTHSRIHHSIQWNKCAPKILNPKHKKTMDFL